MASSSEKSMSPVQSPVLSNTKKDILDITGSNGPWQRRIFLVLFLLSIPECGLNLAMSFMAPDQDYWCARPPEAANVSVEDWKRFGLPPNDKKCSRYKIDNLPFPLNESINGTTVSCDSWEFDDTFYHSTLLSEWDLVCDRAWLVSLSKSTFMAGILMSVVLSGSLSDRVGRKPTITGFCILMVSAATVCAFSVSFLMFIIARFFIAVGVGGYYNNLYVLLMEVLNPKMRAVYGNGAQLGWSVGFVCLPGVIWFIRDWFWIQMAFTVPCFFFLGMWWMIPESPRWLLSTGRVEEAKKILIKAAKTNGMNHSDINVAIQRVIDDTSEDSNTEESGGSFLSLLRIPGLWLVTLNVFFAWFVIAFMYYGLSFNTNELAGDHLVNFSLSGAVEFPAVLFSIVTIRYLGRKRPLAGTLIVGGLVCLVSYFLPKDSGWLSVFFSMAGKFCITCCYGIVYVFTSELFPTVVRNTALGWACLFEQIGSIIAPFVHELGIITQPYVPFVVFGILAATSGIFVLFLPETGNSHVPDKLKDVVTPKRKGKKDISLLEKSYGSITNNSASLGDGDSKNAISSQC